MEPTRTLSENRAAQRDTLAQTIVAVTLGGRPTYSWVHNPATGFRELQPQIEYTKAVDLVQRLRAAGISAQVQPPATPGDLVTVDRRN